MENYIVRMEREKDDLTGKMKKLELAINNKGLHLKECQVDLMKKQYSAMSNYLDILSERIAYEKTKHNR